MKGTVGDFEPEVRDGDLLFSENIADPVILIVIAEFR